MTTKKDTMPANEMRKVRTHLEYLGYEIEEKDEGVIWASHPRLVDLYMADKADGFLFFGWLKTNELAETHRLEFTECLNPKFPRAFEARSSLRHMQKVASNINDYLLTMVLIGAIV